jgi:galactose-1-phosphate uridylyltransferase
MKFESWKKETVILNPLKNMERRVIPSEIRKDPLTGRTARICHFMKLEWERPDFEKMTAGTAERCPFCPDRVMKITPLFPEEILPEGRLIRDDMVLFPNLAPYDSLSSVAVMGAAHYIPMTNIEPELIARAFRLAILFFERLEAIRHPESVYHMINWNYMPPSGSSIIHPHLQIVSSSWAPNLLRTELDAANAYAKARGTNFWEDWVKAETQTGERFLARIGRTSWFMHFAPLGVAGDVLGVVEGARSLLDLSDPDLLDIATGLTRAMKAYDKMGIYSFNMNFFPGAKGDDFTRLHLVFSPRTFFNQSLGTPDVGAGQKLFNESVCMAFPEEITGMLRPDFQS